jgi:hypothetical protein
MARKTVEVRYLVERGNYFLAHSEPEQRDERKGVCSMVELALHKANAYKGYRHLESAVIDHSFLDAYNRDPEGCGMTGAESVEKAFANADDTRREYL